MAKLSYLAAPYSNKDAAVVGLRYEKLIESAAALIEMEEVIVSPVLTGHPFVVRGFMEGDWKTWESYCLRLLTECSKIIILTLDGWEQSEGLKAEIKLAEAMRIDIGYMSPEDIKSHLKKFKALKSNEVKGR